MVTFRGMGHDLPRELWPAIIDEIRALADPCRPSEYAHVI